MTACPRCGAAVFGPRQPTDKRCVVFDCATMTLDGAVDSESDQCKLRQIAALCRRHANPASNVGAHALAAAVLLIIEGGAE